jgi:hypothetical protein
MKSALAIGLLLSLSAAQAAELGAPSGAPLASGKPAGVRQARLVSQTGVLLVGGAALIGVAAALAAANNDNSASAPSTAISTTSTNP